MYNVRPKKRLGQHFLHDQNIAAKIVGSLNLAGTSNILEIGPGKGILTRYLIDLPGKNIRCVEIDRESVEYLNAAFENRIDVISGDFLRTDPGELFDGPFAVIGNFPYNISSQILFRILSFRDRVTQVVGMLQKEVAERIASPPGSKNYGILSVLLQAYYRIEYLFTVNPSVFHPPPGVKSAVIRLTRNSTTKLDCDENLFFTVVKTAFNQRRKILRNSLKPVLANLNEDTEGLQIRPEQLTVEDFVALTLHIEQTHKNG